MQCMPYSVQSCFVVGFLNVQEYHVCCFLIISDFFDGLVYDYKVIAGCTSGYASCLGICWLDFFFFYSFVDDSFNYTCGNIYLYGWGTKWKPLNDSEYSDIKICDACWFINSAWLKFYDLSRECIPIFCIVISLLYPYYEDILPKGPYLPCVSIAGRALLAGYHRLQSETGRWLSKLFLVAKLRQH